MKYRIDGRTLREIEIEQLANFLNEAGYPAFACVTYSYIDTSTNKEYNTSFHVGLAPSFETEDQARDMLKAFYDQTGLAHLTEHITIEEVDFEAAAQANLIKFPRNNYNFIRIIRIVSEPSR